MPAGHLAKDLVGEKHQVFPLSPLGAEIGQKEGGGGGHGGTIRVVRGLLDNVGQELHGQIRVDGIGDGQPDALTKGSQGLGLVGLEKDVAGIGGGLKVLVGDEDIQYLPAQGPGLGPPLQADQGAGHLQAGIREFGGGGLRSGKVIQPLPQGLQMRFESRLLGGQVDDGVRGSVGQPTAFDFQWVEFHGVILVACFGLADQAAKGSLETILPVVRGIRIGRFEINSEKALPATGNFLNDGRKFLERFNFLVRYQNVAEFQHAFGVPLGLKSGDGYAVSVGECKRGVLEGEPSARAGKGRLMRSGGHQGRLGGSGCLALGYIIDH